MKLSKILAACLIAAAGTTAFAQAKFNLKMGHAVNTTDGQHAAATKWKSLCSRPISWAMTRP